MTTDNLTPYVGTWSGTWQNDVKTRSGEITLIVTPEGTITGDSSEKTSRVGYGTIKKGKFTAPATLTFEYNYGPREWNSNCSFQLSPENVLQIRYRNYEGRDEHDRGTMTLKKKN